MGLAAKIDPIFASEQRVALKNMDSALKLQNYKVQYLEHFERAFLEVGYYFFYNYYLLT